MKKSLYLLAALSLLGTNVFAKEVVAAPTTTTETIAPVAGEIREENVNEETQVMTIVEVPEDKWTFNGRTYLEFEDFDNGSRVASGDDEDGTFWGTGVSASKGKLTLDLNVEKRFGGDLSVDKSNANWESLRVDWKVRYQVFANQGFHLKYRNEERTRDYNRETYHNNWTRDRYELGTDFNHFNGMLAGWLVAGIDRDKETTQTGDVSRDNGWYWEGDFGPSFKLTDKLSFNPTIYTTGEMYDSYEMVETQIRFMMPYQATEKLTIMPRIRLTLDRTHDAKWDGRYIEQYENKFGSKIRYELMANYVINEAFSTFVGVAYEHNTRTYKNDDKLFSWTQPNGDHDIDLIWAYVGLNYKF
ncbi:MAG: hypothetical protein RR523_04670 [Cetobacterium sp.]|uniref:hypothetical protein n=1 Tax=Cetobacterium sp. TaxID=2071632 RepID=UPI003AA041B4